ncbi:low-density lipoprotein receptor-related protein 12-like [Saccoglossus kowalevskii]
MAIKVLCLCCLYFMCNIGGSIEQESSEDFYRVVNMFTGICWQSITAEAGIIYTRHLEFGINMMVNLNCKVTIMAPFDGQRVVLNFAAFDIHESEGCTSDKVLVYDGDNIQSELLTPLEGLCGDSAPESFNSSGNSLTIRFVTDHNDTYEFQQKGGFVAYFTAFIPESDDTSVILDDLLPEDWNDQYCCRVGGMCIPIKYTCDGFKNCADNSDEELSKCTEGGNILDILSELTGLSRGTIIGLIILMLLVVLLVLLAIIYYCCCRDKRKVKRKLTKKNYIAQDEYEYDDYQYPFAAMMI